MALLSAILQAPGTTPYVGGEGGWAQKASSRYGRRAPRDFYFFISRVREPTAISSSSTLGGILCHSPPRVLTDPGGERVLGSRNGPEGKLVTPLFQDRHTEAQKVACPSGARRLCVEPRGKGGPGAVSPRS